MKPDYIFKDLVKTNTEQFYNELTSISYLLGIRPQWLEFCIWFETGRTMDHKIQNPTTKATGLIQFMPATAKILGTSTENLLKMSNVQQLEYVKKYFINYKNKLLNFVDVYLVIFFPLAVGKDDNFVIETKSLPAELIAKQNPIFDLNKDGEITKREIKNRLLSLIPDKYKEYFF